MSEIKYDTKECPLYIGNTCHALDKAYRVGRADAIDEFAQKIMDIMPNDIDARVHNGSICLDILALAEQIKEQKHE